MNWLIGCLIPVNATIGRYRLRGDIQNVEYVYYNSSRSSQTADRNSCSIVLGDVSNCLFD